jgi:hypothetical protein
VKKNPRFGPQVKQFENAHTEKAFFPPSTRAREIGKQFSLTGHLVVVCRGDLVKKYPAHQYAEA